jgi:hypothetical protein
MSGQIFKHSGGNGINQEFCKVCAVPIGKCLGQIPLPKGEGAPSIDGRRVRGTKMEKY